MSQQSYASVYTKILFNLNFYIGSIWSEIESSKFQFNWFKISFNWVWHSHSSVPTCFVIWFMRKNFHFLYTKTKLYNVFCDQNLLLPSSAKLQLQLAEMALFPLSPTDSPTQPPSHPAWESLFQNPSFLPSSALAPARPNLLYFCNFEPPTPTHSRTWES